jgi:tungstate transport system substrate-binding protein
LNGALAGFSGYIAADELYDGPYCVLSIVDNHRFKRLVYEVLDHNPTEQEITKFFRRFQEALKARGLSLQGITTDGPELYPTPIANVFGSVHHQVCQFHVIAELNKAVLKAVAKVRRKLKATLPKVGRGRPSPETRFSRNEQLRSNDMIKGYSNIVMVMLVLAASGCGTAVLQDTPKGTVRVAVIGGMTMTGMWQEVSKMFEAQTGYKVEVVKTGQRPLLATVFRAGRADLLTMHSGDITTNLVAEGYGVNMRPWTQNDLVVVGPVHDPAEIRGLHDGAEAFRRIATAKANFVDFQGVGSREVCHSLWAKAGIRPKGDWFLQDQSNEHLDILSFAVNRDAYVVVGRMPVLFNKLKAANMEILVENDPAMRRPYIVMEADPKRFPNTNVAGGQGPVGFFDLGHGSKLLGQGREQPAGGCAVVPPREQADGQVARLGWRLGVFPCPKRPPRHAMLATRSIRNRSGNASCRAWDDENRWTKRQSEVEFCKLLATVVSDRSFGKWRLKKV